MLDVVAGSAFDVSEEALRSVLAHSNAASPVSAKTPHVLQASLVAPYADGFAFVQRHRAAGGWDAVDAALRTPPASTEQILHDDKLAAREPPVPVPPTFAALGPGFRAADDDVIGEQGLRLILEEWTSGAEAAQAAAGWGGDHYVVARHVIPPWPWPVHAVMDSGTDADAAELAARPRQEAREEGAASGRQARPHRRGGGAVTRSGVARGRPVHAPRPAGRLGGELRPAPRGGSTSSSALRTP